MYMYMYVIMCRYIDRIIWFLFTSFELPPVLRQWLSKKQCISWFVCVFEAFLDLTKDIFRFFGRFSTFLGFLFFLYFFWLFYGIREVREVSRKLPGSITLHSDRIWARIEPWRVHLCWFWSLRGNSVTPNIQKVIFLDTSFIRWR